MGITKNGERIMWYVAIIVCLLIWSFFGLTLAILWIKADDKQAFSKADALGERRLDLEYYMNMSGKYVIFMGGPVVWVILCVTCFQDWKNGRKT